MKNRTWEEEIYWTNFHFSQFALTLPSDFRQHLTLPKKFSEYVRTKLPEQIVLKVNGLSWNVDLKKDEDGIMFYGVGWEEFANAYSLEKGDVLFFRYNRRECFEVWLFDRASSCEKEASYYVRGNSDNDDGRDDDEEEDHNDCIEDTVKSLSKRNTDDTSQEEQDDCHYTARNRRNPVRTPKSSSAKTARLKDVSSDDEDVSDENSDEENSVSEEAKITPNRVALTTSARKLPTNSSRKRKRNGARKISGKGSRLGLYAMYYKSNRRKITDEEIEDAEKKARVASEQCANSFIVVMRPTCVYKRFFMTIPAEWKLRKYFRKGQEVSLKVQEKIWDCSICNGRYGFEGVKWKTFARDNLLEEYDVCLFVPSASKNDDKFVFDVSIFRVVPEVVPPTLET